MHFIAYIDQTERALPARAALLRETDQAAQTAAPSPQVIELCVMCTAPTRVNFCDDVDERENFVEGVGQLCRACAEDILTGG